MAALLVLASAILPSSVTIRSIRPSLAYRAIDPRMAVAGAAASVEADLAKLEDWTREYYTQGVPR